MNMAASHRAHTDPSDDERGMIARANDSGRTPIVFLHGLWLLQGSWERWAEYFEQHGYIALCPGWPDDPDSVEDANAHPELFVDQTVGRAATHFEAVIRLLARRPVLIGHSFGGMLAQLLAGRGLAAATVAIDPAPFRGVLPLPLSALRSAWPVLGNPANRHRGVPLTFEQFRYAFANAVSEDEAATLYRTYVVPAPGAPVFQAASANFNPWTEVAVDTESPGRGPLLVMSGELDHTVPHAVAHAAYQKQLHNPGVTEFVEMPGRGHALTIDSGWREVASTALSFVQRFVQPREVAP